MLRVERCSLETSEKELLLSSIWGGGGARLESGALVLVILKVRGAVDMIGGAWDK